MSNSSRGERRMKLNHKVGDRAEVRVRLSLTTLGEIEDDLGVTITNMSRQEGGPGISQMITVAHHAIRSGGHDVTRAEAGEIIEAVGYKIACNAIADMIAESLGTGNIPIPDGDQEKE